jgi:NAD-dependent DNA ligase
LCTQILGRKVTELGSFNLNFYAHAFGYELPELATALDKSKATAAIMLGLVRLSETDSLAELADRNDVRWGSISSAERITCKSNRRYDQSVSKADLQAMRDKFEADGFDETHPLFGKYVLVTGTLRKGTGSEIDKLIAQVGAYPEASFTKKTNYLVVGFDRIDGLSPGGKPTGKITKSIEARAKGQMVEVIDEQAFLNLLED